VACYAAVFRIEGLAWGEACLVVVRRRGVTALGEDRGRYYHDDHDVGTANVHSGVGADIVDSIITATQEAFEHWVRRGNVKRARLMRARQPLLAVLLFCCQLHIVRTQGTVPYRTSLSSLGCRHDYLRAAPVSAIPVLRLVDLLSMYMLAPSFSASAAFSAPRPIAITYNRT